MDVERDAKALVRMLCCGNLERAAAHWVPDARADHCHRCEQPFGHLLRRKHHCRCCGNVVCASCSEQNTQLLGWGIEHIVRACDGCYRFEKVQLPMLLGGDNFSTPGGWAGFRKKRFVWLDADQRCLMSAPWADEPTEVDRSRERRFELSKVAKIELEAPRTLVLRCASSGGANGERLDLETSSERVALAWLAALQALHSIHAVRHRHERMYSGLLATSGSASPRTINISTPRLQLALQRRQAALMAACEQACVARVESGEPVQSTIDAEAALAAEEAEVVRLRERQRRREGYLRLHEKMRQKYGASDDLRLSKPSDLGLSSSAPGGPV